MFVRKVESNIKMGVVAQLGPKTLITGTVGSGKSSIVQAIELALTGSATDIAGRAIVAKDADLMCLAPPGADRAWSLVRFDDGSEAQWQLTAGHRAVRTGPEGIFPLWAVRKAILGSAETARKWILDLSSSALQRETVLERVAVSLKERVASIMPGSGAQALVTALETARSRMRDASARVKGALETSQYAAAGAAPPNPTRIVELDRIITAWAQIFGAPKEALETEVAGLRTRLAREEAKKGDLEREIATLPAPVGSPTLVAAAIAVAEAMVAAQAKGCPICGTDGILPIQVERRLARAKDRAAESMKQERSRVELAAAIRVAATEVRAARQLLQMKLQELARAVPVETPSIPKAEAAAELEKLRKAEVAWRSAQAAEEARLQAERDRASWEEVADALAAVLAWAVDAARSEIEAKVQAFLPSTDRFGIELLDGEREVLRIGLRRPGGVLHMALSGNEWARVTAAIAMVAAPKDGPVVIVPEDRAFDGSTLVAVMEGFDKCPNQVIIASTTAPDPTRVPIGWTVIELPRPRRRSPDPEITPETKEAIPEAEAKAREKAKAPKKVRTRVVPVEPEPSEAEPAPAPPPPEYDPFADMT